MEVKELMQRGCQLQGKFEVSDVNNGYACVTISTPEYTIHGVLTFQIQVIITKMSNGYSSEYNNLIFIKITKVTQDKNNYQLKFSSQKFNIDEQCFKCDDTAWRLVYELKATFNYSFDVTALIEMIDDSGTFETLHEDKELTDFELKGVDGTVCVHKAVIAASSSVLRCKLEKEWRGVKEGLLNEDGTSAQDLQHFKDYLYLRKLPETGLQQLLLLAAYCLMPELEQKCIDKLMTTVSAHNALQLSEFAVKHKMTKLHLAVLECFQCGTVKVEEMRDVCLNGKHPLGDKEQNAVVRKPRPRSHSNSLRLSASRTERIKNKRCNL